VNPVRIYNLRWMHEYLDRQHPVDRFKQEPVSVAASEVVLPWQVDGVEHAADVLGLLSNNLCGES
jgi:hypothetical protein